MAMESDVMGRVVTESTIENLEDLWAERRGSCTSDQVRAARIEGAVPEARAEQQRDFRVLVVRRGATDDPGALLHQGRHGGARYGPRPDRPAPARAPRLHHRPAQPHPDRQ